MNDESIKDHDKVSNCCGAAMYSNMDICSDCKEHCDAVCEYCGGEGDVPIDVDDGEGHMMKGVGTRKCICQLQPIDDSHD